MPWLAVRLLSSEPAKSMRYILPCRVLAAWVLVTVSWTILWLRLECSFNLVAATVLKNPKYYTVKDNTNMKTNYIIWVLILLHLDLAIKTTCLSALRVKLLLSLLLYIYNDIYMKSNGTQCKLFAAWHSG